MRAGLIVLTGVVLLGACAAPAPSVAPRPTPDGPSHVAIATPTPSPAPAVTPRPPVTPQPRQVGDPFEPVPISSPAASLPPMPQDPPLRARREVDGIKVTIALDRNPMPAGEPTWISVSVQNTGADDVTWFHGCPDAVSTFAYLDARWREGIPLAFEPGQFKRYALGQGLRGPGPAKMWIDFESDWRIGGPPTGCGDTGRYDTLGPGEIVKGRQRWDGFTNRQLDHAPAVPVRLVATARYFWRSRDGEPSDIAAREIELGLDAWISPGKPAGRLDPPEVIDIALTDPQFAAWFANRDFASGTEEWVKYVPSVDRWQVGLLQWYVPRAGEATLTYLVIHPETGEILRRVSRIWDQHEDGWP